MQEETSMELQTIRVDFRKEPCDIRIHRGTFWGNPYVIGKDGDRTDVIAKYEDYVRSSKIMMRRLHELQGKRLGCFCDSTTPCHGDVLIKLIKELGGQ